MNLFQVRSKIWLEIDGKPFLGAGRYRILSAIHNHGSINAASRALGMSYRKVWAQLQAMEETAPFPLLAKRTGGKDGGATHLTPATLELLGKFETMRTKVNSEADRCFMSCFPNTETIDNV
ncbi:MAG: winged helix-turn-helix domain-containing protein [Desulfuromonadales bacterium]|jgi:molybdate transport system regulatory protein|nr:winged helix-turn-helix domain-containing protein [Desulfuromonadales bacterium]MDH3868470.1 winged helix-turn-helix domain-containing protein [Desulfuromonadales bacterium]MDH4024517.1 winged helix-turn-helix domain-containing protein [Desulfuromonadales bacterium]